IDLLVRGICCLRPGVPGLSERIRVVGIVDRFLEHTRCFAFGARDPEVYLSSADWMPRNFQRRIEVMFPIEDPEIRARVLSELVDVYLRDIVKAHELGPDGAYQRVCLPGPPLRSQQILATVARRTAAGPIEPAIRPASAPEAATGKG